MIESLLLGIGLTIFLLVVHYLSFGLIEREGIIPFLFFLFQFPLVYVLASLPLKMVMPSSFMNALTTFFWITAIINYLILFIILIYLVIYIYGTSLGGTWHVIKDQDD